MTGLRIFGLDIIRATAIGLVLIAHLVARVAEQLTAANINLELRSMLNLIDHTAGIFGVELFFVLSGFLIGQILIKQFSKQFDMGSIYRFWLRRWFRTLPAYYVVLLILMIIKHHIPNNLVADLPYFFFLQGFGTIQFFPVSWSLAIEEWFYLLLPLTLLLFIRLKRSAFSKTSILKSLIFLILFLILIRFAYVFIKIPAFDSGLRKFTPLRFDSLLIGVLLAHIKIYFNDIYQLFKSKKLYIISSIFFVTTYIVLTATDIMMSNVLFGGTIGITLINILTVFQLAFLEQSHTVNIRLPQIKPLSIIVNLLSTYSYSLYLVHASVFYLFATIVQTQDISLMVLVQLLALVCSFIAAFILYSLLEKPFLRLRDSLVPA